MGIRNWLEEAEKENETLNELGIRQIVNMKLSDLAKRDIALKIHSKVLNAEVWLCSDSEMEKQIQNDDPEAITYSVDEVRELIRLRPTPHELRKINDIKAVFRGSKVIRSN